MFDLRMVGKLERNMAFHPTMFKRLLVVSLLAGVALTRSFGQAADSPIKFLGPEAIVVTMVDPPTVGSSSTARGEAGQWLKIDYKFQITPKAQSAFVDSVTFSITVEGRDLYATDAPTADGVPIGLTGNATYINLAASKEAHGVFYIHPSTMARYSTKSGIRDFTSRFNIHIDAMVEGKLADYFDLKTDPSGPDWYKPSTGTGAGLRPVPNLVYRQDQCCFIVNDPSQYPELKHSRRSSPIRLA